MKQQTRKIKAVDNYTLLLHMLWRKTSKNTTATPIRYTKIFKTQNKN